uniref:TMEM62 Ig-like domain-containing protein n=1 Tax=Timema poppense TaxID=170557 RepID=A0A7R9DMD7_TIMPO|nr:unnamed protein product [Timema poppensis]
MSWGKVFASGLYVQAEVKVEQEKSMSLFLLSFGPIRLTHVSDNFNVLNLESKENYYRNYSIQGVSHPRSYLHQISKGGDKYSFIGVDACLEPGPRRPFNFVGMLRKNEMEHVRNLSEEAHRQGSNYTIWFGHYPTSCILTPGPGGVRALIGSHREGLVYLCGHYHTLGGMVSNMYTLQQAGFLELELGDWKDNRLYRVAAVDHGLFSFIDVHHRDWPVILITNPKHTLYKMPTREPLNRMRNSTHIRMLIFSLSHIVDVQVKVDEEGWRPCTEVKGPLYVAMWEPNKYAQGLHYIHVHVEDGDGRVKTITQPFSLDDTRLGFHLLPRFVLMSNISLVFQLMFGFMLVICVVPLCILRVLHILLKGEFQN